MLSGKEERDYVQNMDIHSVGADQRIGKIHSKAREPIVLMNNQKKVSLRDSFRNVTLEERKEIS